MTKKTPQSDSMKIIASAALKNKIMLNRVR